MKIFLLGCTIGVVWLLADHQIDKAHVEGFKLGMHYALKSDPPSEQLEMTCAGLWVGKQNQKMWNKQNAR
jgi:hypothetical protein